jgi:hypothetical protein
MIVMGKNYPAPHDSGHKFTKYGGGGDLGVATIAFHSLIGTNKDACQACAKIRIDFVTEIHGGR